MEICVLPEFPLLFFKNEKQSEGPMDIIVAIYLHIATDIFSLLFYLYLRIHFLKKH